MKSKVLKSILTPILGLSVIGTIAITSTSCGSNESFIIPVENIEFDDENDFELANGSSCRLNVSVYPTVATNKEVTWTSSNDEVATVDQEGNVIGVSKGTVTITVSSVKNPDVKNTCTIKVVSPIPTSGVELDEEEIELAINEDIQLEATILPENAANKEVTWQSSNEEVVTVDQEGNVKGVSNGEATITVTTVEGSHKATCEVTVHTPIREVQLGYDWKIPLGYSKLLTADVYPKNASNKELIWEIGDEEIATVDENGIVTGVSLGTTTITVKSKENPGIYSTREVNVVTIPVAGISFEQKNYDLAIDSTFQIKPIIYPEDATNQNVSWTSSDDKIATVDKNGKVTGISKGQATITGTVVSGRGLADCKVNVYTPIKRIGIGGNIGGKIVEFDTTKPFNDPSVCYQGHSIQLLPIIEPEDTTYEKIIWNVTDNGYISENGIITFMSNGIVRVHLVVKTKYGDSLEKDVLFYL